MIILSFEIPNKLLNDLHAIKISTLVIGVTHDTMDPIRMAF